MEIEQMHIEYRANDFSVYDYRRNDIRASGDRASVVAPTVHYKVHNTWYTIHNTSYTVLSTWFTVHSTRS